MSVRSEYCTDGDLAVCAVPVWVWVHLLQLLVLTLSQSTARELVIPLRPLGRTLENYWQYE